MEARTASVSVRPSAPRNVTPLPFNLLKRDVWLHALIAAAILAYCVSSVAVARPSGIDTFWDGVFFPASEVLPVIAMVLCAWRWPAQRLAWLTMSAGIIVHALGDLTYAFHDVNLVPTPVPASSDYLFFGAYALLVLGVLLLTQSHVGRVRAALRIEGLVAGLAVAALAALFWYGPVLSSSGALWRVIVADGYPVGNLVLLVLLISSLAPYRYQPNVPVALLLGAVAWFVFGDVVYFNQATSGNFVSRTFLNATWLVGLWFAGLAATAVDRRRSGALRRSRPSESGARWAPVVAGAAFLAVAINYLIVPDVNTASMLLAGLGLVLVGANVVLAKRDLARALDERQGVDPVTGLPDAASFLEQVESWLEGEGVVGVVVLDVVDFAQVNGTIGYAIADELLWVIGRRAQYRLADQGIFARLSGDDFAFGARVASASEFAALASVVHGLVADRFHLTGFSVGVEGRIGQASAPAQSISASDLLANARVALENHTPPLSPL